jgi:hypothetical protein
MVGMWGQNKTTLFMARKQERERVKKGLGSHNPFQGHAPNELKTSK